MQTINEDPYHADIDNDVRAQLCVRLYSLKTEFIQFEQVRII